MARSKRGGAQEINASSMADIAFLLLIFFLVTTTIEQKKGILHKLPPHIDEPQDIPPINDRNVLEILVNARDQILVENEYYLEDVKELRELTVLHITNNGRSPEYSDSPDKAVVSLKNDVGTSYGLYIGIQNELKAAYREVRDEEALRLTSGAMTYNELDECSDAAELDETKAEEARKCDILKDQIKDKYPMKISEAEPEEFGNK